MAVKVLAAAAGLALLAAGVVVGANVATTTTTVAPAAAIATVASRFPSPTSTGVAPDAVLTAYTGPPTITACGTVIDHKIITGGLNVRVSNGKEASFPSEAAAKAAACVTITNSKFVVAGGTDTAISTRWTTDTTCKVGSVAHACGPVYMADSTVTETGTPTGIINLLNETNFHLWRDNISGGDQAVNCDGYCDIHGSWLEASKLDTTGNAHMDGFSSNGNDGHPIVLDGNTLYCHVTNSHPAGSGGCSADIGFFGDFGTVSNVTVTNNFFRASSDQYWCTYTGGSQPAKPNKVGSGLTWSGNVFERGPSQRCGGEPGQTSGGAVADWGGSSTNIWCGNTWDTGGFVLPGSETCTSPTSTTTIAIPTTTTTTSPAPTTTVTLPPPPPTTTVTVPSSTTSTTARSTTTTVTPTTTVPATTTTLPCLRTSHGDLVCQKA